MAKLGDYVNIRTGKLDANAASENGKYPFFTCAVSTLKIDTYGYDCECVLVAGNGDLNVKYYCGKFDAYQRTYIIESKDKSVLSVRYLYYFLDQYVETLRKESIGGVIKYIKLGNLSEASISIPSLEVQCHIVSVLDKVTDLIAQRRAQLDKLDLLVKSRFVEIFGDPVLNPNNYKIRSLQSLIDEKIITYHLDGNHGGDYPRSEEFVSAGVPYIGANCIRNGKIDFSQAKYLTKERADKLRKGIAQDGDVLFAHNATVGPVVVLETKEPKIILSTSLTAYRCNRKVILPSYLKAYMLSDGFVRQYSEEMKQTTRNQVPITAQRKYMFMLPPISQQEEFDTFVVYTDKVKVQIQTSLEKMKLLRNALMQKYFKGI